MKIFILLLFVAILPSCTTYIIPKLSLVEQLGSIDSTQLVNRQVIGPIATHYEYLANPIAEIKCEDKYGQQNILTNSPSIEIRVTESSGKKTIFYFDRILIVNNQLLGVRSRFASFVDKTIDLENIQLIEVQDGKKNFKYSNNYSQ